MMITNRLRNLSIGLVLVAVTIVGASLNHLTYAASGSLSLSPSSASANVGDNLVVTMNENSGTDAAIGVDAFVNYPSSQLQFISATTVAPFSVAPPDSASGGTVEITRGAYSGQTGNQAVTVITFKVLAAGTAAVTFNNAKSSIAPAAGSGNLLTTSSGGSYTLSTPSSGGGSSVGGGGSSSGGSPATQPATPKGTSVSVAPKTSSSASAVTVPNNGNVAVSTPVSVQPATIQTDGVQKIEYYLGGKLVDTETKPPYKYNIDTTKLKNGVYNLVSKTYYTNGSVKQTTQHLIVKNTAAHSSFTWLYILLGLVVLSVLWINFIGPSLNGPFRHLPDILKRPGPLAAGPSSSNTVVSMNPEHPRAIPAQDHISLLSQKPATPEPGTVVLPNDHS